MHITTSQWVEGHCKRLRANYYPQRLSTAPGESRSSWRTVWARDGRSLSFSLLIHIFLVVTRLLTTQDRLHPPPICLECYNTGRRRHTIRKQTQDRTSLSQYIQWNVQGFLPVRKSAFSSSGKTISSELMNHVYCTGILYPILRQQSLLF